MLDFRCILSLWHTDSKKGISSLLPENKWIGEMIRDLQFIYPFFFSSHFLPKFECAIDPRIASHVRMKTRVSVTEVTVSERDYCFKTTLPWSPDSLLLLFLSKLAQMCAYLWLSPSPSTKTTTRVTFNFTHMQSETDDSNTLKHTLMPFCVEGMCVSFVYFSADVAGNKTWNTMRWLTTACMYAVVMCWDWCFNLCLSPFCLKKSLSFTRLSCPSLC